MLYKKSKNYGFTIIELTIVMIIFGFFISIALYGLRVYLLKSEIAQTKESLKLSQAAMLEFRSKFGRYPCPADPGLSSTNANYGREITPCAATGKMKSVTGRNADGVGGGDEIIVGSIPL